MISMTDLNEVDKIIRSFLIQQSQLDPNMIRHSLSRYGTQLDVNQSDDIFESISPNDLLILFEPRSRQSNSNISFTDNDEIVQYVSLTYHIYIYGDRSLSMANLIKSRLLTEQCRLSLVDEGVYLENISPVQSINEYDNNVLWMRTDFDIYVSVECKYDQVQIEQNYESANFNIITKE